jgi:hypothetical protein
MTSVPPFSLDAARALLAPFGCEDLLQIDSPDEKAQVGQALRLLVQESDFQTLGVCADSAATGFAALANYLNAIDYLDPEMTTDRGDALADEPTYIKFNTQTGQCYSSPYSGPSRGVLVCCHSLYSDGNTDIYGYLPLNLFDA